MRNCNILPSVILCRSTRELLGGETTEHLIGGIHNKPRGANLERFCFVTLGYVHPHGTQLTLSSNGLRYDLRPRIRGLDQPGALLPLDYCAATYRLTYLTQRIIV